MENGQIFKIVQPLIMTWNPKEDITTFELAKCIEYFHWAPLPDQVDLSEPHFRHFEINDPNK